MICKKGEDFYFDGIHWIKAGKGKSREFYFRGCVEKGGGYVSFHRYMYEKHNSKIPKGYDVHHIDFNPLNNNPENLTLLKKGDHMRLHNKGKKLPYSTRLAVIESNKKRTKPVICLNDGKLFNSIKSASEFYKICSTQIIDVVKNKQGQTRGLKFEYYKGGT